MTTPKFDDRAYLKALVPQSTTFSFFSTLLRGRAVHI